MLFHIILIIGLYYCELRFSKFYATIFSIVFLYNFLFPIFFSKQNIFNYSKGPIEHIFYHGSSDPDVFTHKEGFHHYQRRSKFISLKKMYDENDEEHIFRRTLRCIFENIPIFNSKISEFEFLMFICGIIVLLLRCFVNVQILMVFNLILSSEMRAFIYYTEHYFSITSNQKYCYIVVCIATALAIFILSYFFDIFKNFILLSTFSVYAGVFFTNIIAAFLEPDQEFQDLHWIEASFKVNSNIDDCCFPSKIDLKNYQLMLIGFILGAIICNIIFRRKIKKVVVENKKE